MDESLQSKLRADFPPEALSKDNSRGFDLTSIKAMYVIERLNDVFSEFGWKYKFTKPVLIAEKEYITRVTLQILKDDADIHPISQYGGKRIVKDNHADAIKSSITDGLTKCASILGIGHSVFKGKQTSDDKPSEQKEKKSEDKTEDECTEAQRKKIYAMCSNIGVSDKEAKGWMASRYKVESSTNLTKKEASDFIKFLGEIEKQQ